MKETSEPRESDQGAAIREKGAPRLEVQRAASPEELFRTNGPGD